MFLLREYQQIEEEITVDADSDEATRLAVLRLRGDAMLAQQRVPEARAIYQEILSVRENDLDTMLAVATSYVTENELLQARATLDYILSLDPEYAPAWLASGSLAALHSDYARAEQNFAKGAEIAAAQGDLAGHIRGLTGVFEAQLAQRKGEEARQTVEMLATLDPQSPFNEYLAARAAYLNEDYADALANLRALLERAPKYVPARVLMGAIHLRQGDVEQARTVLQLVSYEAPDNLAARKLLAEVRLAENRSAEASRLLEPLLGGGLADADTLVMAVRASLGAGDFDEAIGYLRMRAEADPENVNLQMDLAAALLGSGNVEEAEALLQALPVVTEDDAYRRDLLLIMAPVRNEDFEAALRAAEELQKDRPDDPKLLNLLGGILDAAGDRVAARQYFETARATDPKDIASRISLGRIEINAGNFGSAAQLYEEALGIQPENVGILVSLGRIATFRRDRAAAVEWLEKAREADDRNLTSRVLLARLYFEAGDFSAAEAVAREGLEVDPEIADLYDTLGQVAAARGDNPTAVENFQTAVELGPGQPRFSVNLAMRYADMANTDRATDVLLDALKVRPDHLQTALLLANLYVQAGEAAEQLPMALELSAEHGDAIGPRVLLAELYFGNRQFERSLELYDDILASTLVRDIAVRAYQLRSATGEDPQEKPLLDYLAARPEDAEVRLALALEYQAHGAVDKAVEHYARVLDVAPNSIVALNNLAMLYLDRGNPEAVPLARRAVEMAPDNGAILDTLGWILVQTGSVDEGVDYLRKANELSGDSTEVRYHLAVGLAETGRTDEARALLNQVLADDDFPGRGDAEALLGRL